MPAQLGSHNVAGALRGLQVHGNLTPSILPRITFSPTIGITASKVDKLGLNIKSFKEPLKRSIQKVLAPSFTKNFDSGGRPPWEPLSAATIEVRERLRSRGGTSPLIKTGQLRRTMGQFNIWTVNETSAILGALPQSVWYGALHQAGYSSGRKAKSTGSIGRGIGMSTYKGIEGRKLGAREVNIPQRQFVLLQPEDTAGITEEFSKWLEERIAKDWAER
jgi:phage gpG-like protein